VVWLDGVCAGPVGATVSGCRGEETSQASEDDLFFWGPPFVHVVPFPESHCRENQKSALPSSACLCSERCCSLSPPCCRLAGVNFFSKPQRFQVYFNESIHGLDLGSAGEAARRAVGSGGRSENILYNAATNKSVVSVVCEFSRNMIIDDKARPIDLSERAALQAMVDHGLRAQLGVVGLANRAAVCGARFL